MNKGGRVCGGRYGRSGRCRTRITVVSVVALCCALFTCRGGVHSVLHPCLKVLAIQVTCSEKVNRKRGKCILHHSHAAHATHTHRG